MHRSRIRPHLGRPTNPSYPTVAQDRYPVSQGERLVVVVGDVDNRLAEST
jgi:hypothetical protein